MTTEQLTMSQMPCPRCGETLSVAVGAEIQIDASPDPAVLRIRLTSMDVVAGECEHVDEFREEVRFEPGWDDSL